MKFTILILFFLVACKTPSAENLNPLDQYLNPDLGSESRSITEEYMELVNDHRVSIGLNPLIYSKDIEVLAQNHSDNMASGAVAFGHTGSSERCQNIRSSFGSSNLCGEIVAKGQTSVSLVFQAWMNSSNHKSKIEGARYTHTGFAFKKASNGVIFWTQIFLEVL